MALKVIFAQKHIPRQLDKTRISMILDLRKVSTEHRKDERSRRDSFKRAGRSGRSVARRLLSEQYPGYALLVPTLPVRIVILAVRYVPGNGYRFLP